MKRWYRILPLVIVILALLITGCAPHYGTAREEVAPAAPEARPAAMATALPPKEASAERGAVAYDAAQAERKIILTANLQLTVQETDKTVGAIKDLVAAQGGYVSSANVWREGNVLRAHLTVRVPADRLNGFLADVKKLATRVEREESGGQDVTEEYVDIESELRNLEAAEKELRELLTTVREKTGKAEDVMAVYRELTNIRGQIDRLKGRRQYLDRMTELATVNLDLGERQAEPIGQPGWQPVQTLRRALNALVQAAKLGVDALIWVLAFVVPLLIVPVLAIWLLWFLLRRRRPRA